MFQRAVFFRTRVRGLRRISVAVALAALVIAPAGAQAAVGKNLLARPFVYNRAREVKPFAHERSQASASLDKLLKEGRKREALKAIHTRLDEDGLTPRERSELVSLSARLEVELGNRERAIRKAEAEAGKAGLSKTRKADTYLLLSRLYLAKHPPDFAKAAEYQGRYNDISGNRNRR